MSIKNCVYSWFVNKNANIKYEYEKYVQEHIEEHKLQRWKHIRLLLKLNWFYRVKKSEGPFIYTNIQDGYRNIYEIDERNIEVIRNSDYFDAMWYRNTYKDTINMDPAVHYLTIGWREYRSPGPSFSTLLYLNRYNDAREMDINPLLHYEKIAKAEKRVSSYAGLYKGIKKDIDRIEKSIFWNGIWYQEQYLSNRFYVESPAVHYYCLGCYENKNPGPVFDQVLYEKFHPDVKIKPYPHLLHYEDIGKFSGQGYFHQEPLYYENNNLYKNMLIKLNNILIDIISNSEVGKRVLLISHLLNLTGAPKVLVKMAKILKKHGYYIVVATLHSGELEKELDKEKIPVVTLSEYEDNILSRQIIDFANIFDIIFFNTVESLKLAHILAGTSAYKICWLHEGKMTLDMLPERQIRRLEYMDQIYTCAEYCNKYFEEFVDRDKLEVLHYGIEENEVLQFRHKRNDDSKFVVTILGTVGYRKGHDILIESIEYIDDYILKNLEIRVVGAIIDEIVGNELNKLCETHSNIIYFGEVSNDQAISIIAESDLLIVPSRDDPMPVVITEAMILKKPVLMSSSVGTSSLVTNNVDAFVMEENTPEALSNKIMELFKNRRNLTEIGKNGYKIYLKYLSDVSFEKNILNIFNKYQKHISYENNCDNTIQLTDAEMLSDGINLIFVCAKNNIIRIYSEGIYYEEDSQLYEENRWKRLNSYLHEKQQRIAIIKVNKTCLCGFQGLIISNYFDAIRLEYGPYIWSNLKWISDNYNICINIRKNLLSIYDKEDFKVNVQHSSYISKNIKTIFEEIIHIKDYPYTLYVETRDNKNDNAYQMFRHDLLTNSNAYFVTTGEVIDNEPNEYLKAHYLKLNSAKAKKYMMRARNIVCSWSQLQLFGYEKMQYIYPFIGFQYIFIPHGISYDKNSFYLNKSIWGRFKSCIVSSKYEKNYFEEINGYSNVEVLGYPRMDKWMENKICENEVILFPTWRTEIHEGYINQLLEIAKIKSEHKLIYIAHPSIEEEDYKKICKIIKTINDEVMCIHSKDSENFNKYFSEAKYLITDYSSVAYDFAYKGGIPIYYEPFMKLEPNYSILPEFYDHNCGVMISNFKELESILQDDSIINSINIRAKQFYKYIDSDNTLRVAQYLREN